MCTVALQIPRYTHFVHRFGVRNPSMRWMAREWDSLRTEAVTSLVGRRRISEAFLVDACGYIITVPWIQSHTSSIMKPAQSSRELHCKQVGMVTGHILPFYAGKGEGAYGTRIINLALLTAFLLPSFADTLLPSPFISYVHILPLVPLSSSSHFPPSSSSSPFLPSPFPSFAIKSLPSPPIQKTQPAP